MGQLLVGVIQLCPAFQVFLREGLGKQDRSFFCVVFRFKGLILVSVHSVSAVEQVLVVVYYSAYISGSSSLRIW